MNNWYLKFIALGFGALALGLFGSYLASFCFWQPNIQKGIGFLVAGVGIALVDLVVRRTADHDGVYQEVYIIPFAIFRIPAWVFGIIVGIGGVVLIASGE